MVWRRIALAARVERRAVVFRGVFRGIMLLLAM
jgi:hypothetical protein